MSGHSKWSNIKHKKEKTDSQRGKIFTKLGREIALAVKSGGSDPAVNVRLKDIITKAKSNNMPNDTILKSIKKAAGDVDLASYEEISYEGYGPNGVAVIVEALTDNRNRTAGDVRHYFDKFGGNLGTLGCVSFMFDKKGQIIIENDGKINEEELMMAALEAGAEDFSSDEDYFEILTEPEVFSEVREAMEQAGYDFVSAEITMLPQTMTELTDEDSIKQMMKLVDHLEDLDDVQNIYHNWAQNDDNS